jgi:hypothetical protein
MIKQTCYISLSQPAQGGRVLSIFREILKVSQRNNQKNGLSGYLLFDKRYFAQVLEGEPAAVDAAIGRIKDDPRHRDVRMLGSRERRTRQFANWTMGGATVEVLADREILLRHGLDSQGWQHKLDCAGLIDLALDFVASRKAGA